MKQNSQCLFFPDAAFHSVSTLAALEELAVAAIMAAHGNSCEVLEVSSDFLSKDWSLRSGITATSTILVKIIMVFLILFFKVFFFNLSILRERACKLHAVSTEPTAELEPTNREIMT